MHFYRKCLFGLFKEQFISLMNFGQNYFVQLRWNWFSVRLSVWMFGNAIRCIQHFQAMLERGVCELAHSFFHLQIYGKRSWIAPSVISHFSSKRCASYRVTQFKIFSNFEPISNSYPLFEGKLRPIQHLSVRSLGYIYLYFGLCVWAFSSGKLK